VPDGGGAAGLAALSVRLARDQLLSSGAQVAFEELEPPPLHVRAVLFGPRQMPLVGIDQRLVWLPASMRAWISHAVCRKLDVVVDHVVDHEQVAPPRFSEREH
jgi:hypothetical protein